MENDMRGHPYVPYGACKESDWKLFRQELPVWQENHMEKLVEEYRQLLNAETCASEKFWALEKRIGEDKRNPGVILYNTRRSHMRDDILFLLQYGVITLSDLEGFSQELREDMAWCMKGRT